MSLLPLHPNPIRNHQEAIGRMNAGCIPSLRVQRHFMNLSDTLKFLNKCNEVSSVSSIKTIPKITMVTRAWPAIDWQPVKWFILYSSCVPFVSSKRALKHSPKPTLYSKTNIVFNLYLQLVLSLHQTAQRVHCACPLVVCLDCPFPWNPGMAQDCQGF